MAVLLFLSILMSLQSLSDGSGHHCQNLTWHKNVNADYIISGIFPVHYFSPNKNSFVFNKYGLTWVQAFLFAIDEINNNRNILPRTQLGYAVYDSCNDAAIGLHAALDLIQEPTVIAAPSIEQNPDHVGFRNATECYCNKTKPRIVSVVGDAASASSTKIASVLGARSVVMPQISYSSTSTALSNKVNYPSFLRTIPPDNFQALFIIDLLKRFNWKYVSFVASDDAYGRLGVENLLPLLESEKLCVAFSDVFDVTSNGKLKVKSIVSKLVNDEKSMVTVLWCQYPQAQWFLEEAERQRYYNRTWIATETWGRNNMVTKINPSVVRGLLGIIPAAVNYVPFDEHLDSLQPNNSTFNPWLDEFWEQNDCYRQSNGSYSCNQGKPIPSGRSLPRSKIINVIDAVYAVAHGLESALESNANDSKFFVNGESLFSYIKQIRFSGKADLTVNFNKNGDPGVASYSLTNLQVSSSGKLVFKTVGQWDSVSRKLDILPGSQILFANKKTTPPKSICSKECFPGHYALVYTSKPCCWTCVVCPHNKYQPSYGQRSCLSCAKGSVSNNNKTACIVPKNANLSLKTSWGKLISSLTVIAIISVAFVIAVIGCRWDTPIVKALNRELSCIQLASMVMIFLMPTLHFFEPLAAICITRPFYFIAFYTMSVSVTFTKTDRLMRIFKASSSGRLAKNSRVLNNRVQILTVVALSIIGCVICTIFFFVFPPSMVEEIFRNGDQVTVVYSCGSNYTALFLALLSYIFGISLACGIFAFRARKLPENYNEARYTSFAMFSFCMAWLCFLPLYLSLKLETEKEVTILLVSFISTAAMFCTIYLPKIYVVLFQPKENTMERFRARMKTRDFDSRISTSVSPNTQAQKYRVPETSKSGETVEIKSRTLNFETSTEQNVKDHQSDFRA